MTTDVKSVLGHLVYPITACKSDAIIFYSQLLFPKYLNFFMDEYFPTDPVDSCPPAYFSTLF